MIDNGRVRGLWCANLTPLDRNGRLDGARMAAHIRILLGQGVDGVAPFGTTGEGPSFSVAERRTGLDGLLAAGLPAARIAAGTGASAFNDAVELTRHALFWMMRTRLPSVIVLHVSAAMARKLSAIADSEGPAILAALLGAIIAGPSESPDTQNPQAMLSGGPPLMPFQQRTPAEGTSLD